MLPAQPQERAQAASVAPFPAPSPHILRILHDYYTSEVEVVRMAQVRTRSALVHIEQVAGMVPSMIRADDGAASTLR